MRYSRLWCLDCTRKHIAQAICLYYSSLCGCFQTWVSAGHLYEAASEIDGISESFKQRILGHMPLYNNNDKVRVLLAQSYILRNESLMGYPSHIWFAIGHMANAADIIVDSDFDWANEIRAERLNLMNDYNYNVPFENLIGTSGHPSFKHPHRIRDLLDELTIFSNNCYEASEGVAVERFEICNACGNCEYGVCAVNNQCIYDMVSLNDTVCPIGAWGDGL